jgi:5'(3')-deoxyribonucleotidase
VVQKYLLYWYKSTIPVKAASLAKGEACVRVRVCEYVILALLVQKYLLYWYKSTNTDADIQARDLKDLSEAIKSMPQYKVLLHNLLALLVQKVHMLTQKALQELLSKYSMLIDLFTCFTGTKVQMLTQKALQELLSKYSMHIDLTKKCMAQYEKLQLELVSTEVCTYIY